MGRSPGVNCSLWTNLKARHSFGVRGASGEATDICDVPTNAAVAANADPPQNARFWEKLRRSEEIIV